MALHCQSCGEPVPYDEPVPRDASCENCDTDLRACVQCRHYDTSRNNQCTETEADPVVDKKRRNFCEFFYFSREKGVPRAGEGKRAAEARAKLDALFGGGGAAGDGAPAGEDRATEARRKLEALFRKNKPGGS
jgi:hypothetical protein